MSSILCNAGAPETHQENIFFFLCEHDTLSAVIEMVCGAGLLWLRL